MIQEYVDYFSKLKSALDKIDSFVTTTRTASLSHYSISFRDEKKNYLSKVESKLKECHESSKLGGLKLSDLISMPFQRISKYHLRFADLLKETDKDHSAIECLHKTVRDMKEICEYLNESQRDQESICLIEKLEKHLHLIDSNNTGSLFSLSNDFGRLIKGNLIPVI